MMVLTHWPVWRCTCGWQKTLVSWLFFFPSSGVNIQGCGRARRVLLTTEAGEEAGEPTISRILKNKVALGVERVGFVCS